MRKTVVLFFLLGYIFSATEMGELLKINVLLHHYTEHKTRSKELTFSEFLFIHYVTPHENDGDNDENGKLPFQSNTDQATVNSFFQIIEPSCLYSISFIQQIECDSKNEFNRENLVLKSSFLASIWQPPKLV